ncbi:helix-turn-helix domain-containing protein [Streptomyces nanhaiensis]|uniref:helix-turn-helix domain-containing protein n=1 Tax=Streptomyces nanhaiensis TaxID=679319 RepID=UPI00399D333B
MRRGGGIDRPYSPQEFYGAELQRKRENKGLTQAQLGEMVVISPQMIAHFEAGRRKPRPEDACRIDQALGTDGFFERMRRSLDEGRFADHFAAAAEMEKLACVIKTYGASLVPGILQTEAYARAVFRAGTPVYTHKDVERRVTNRMERARILDDPNSPVLWTLLDESILRRPIGGRGVIAEQLEHVAEMGRSGRVRVHVLPFSTGAHALLESMVTLMRFTDAPPVAYVEGLRTGRVMDDPDMVEACQSAYDLALGDALSSEESLALLEAVSEEYKR